MEKVKIDKVIIGFINSEVPNQVDAVGLDDKGDADFEQSADKAVFFPEELEFVARVGRQIRLLGNPLMEAFNGEKEG